MVFTELQQKIIKDIADNKVKDLNSFYAEYFVEVKKEKLSNDFTGSGLDIMYLPKVHFKTGISTTGIILDDSEISMIREFVLLWKILESNNLVYTYEAKDVRFPEQDKYLLPLYPENKREFNINNINKYNFEAWHLIEDYILKVILSTEDLKVFIKNAYITQAELYSREESRDRRQSNRNTIIVAILSIVLSSLINYLIYKNERIVTITNPTKLPDTLKVINLNQIKSDTIKPKQDTLKPIQDTIKPKPDTSKTK